ncbi:MFS transporter [Corynebacterium mendelii]|uniref:MFS transporter n=3 Tax=Corynebacterium mendelii TaxID=2765362 RepID=UPI003631C576
MPSGAIRRRIILASVVGTTIEFYDFYVYAAAAVAVFPFLFFPHNDDPTVSLLASFATFGLAFAARPLGSVLFGHFGDRIGRKATLVASLLTMGIATFIIGLLPTYATAGIAAPALLALMRFGQGLGLGGEWSGAALLSTETAREGKRAWAAMWPQLGAPLGFIFANGLFLILTSTLGYSPGDTVGAFMAWGWRIPFLLSIVMVVVGLYARFSLEETPVFTKALAEGQRETVPLAAVFRTSLKPLVLGTVVMMSCYTLFFLITTWVLSYGIGSAETGMGLSIPYMEFLELQMVSIFLFLAFIPVAATLADRYGRRSILIGVSLLMVGFAFSFNTLLGGPHANKFTVLVFLCVGMAIMGLVFGPMSAVLPEMFPTSVRYTGSGIAYNASSILGAAIAPFIATWLLANHGVQAVGWYLLVVTLLSLAAVVMMKETRDADMSAI